MNEATTLRAMNETSIDLSPRKTAGVMRIVGDSWVVAKRGLQRIPRQIDWLIGVTVMPVMFLLMFRYVFGGSVQATMPPGVSAVNFLVVGILAQGVVFSGLNTALGLATDAKEGLMDRFRSLPMSHLAVLIGRIITDMVIALFTTLTTVLVGFAVGFRPDASLVDWVRALRLMLLAAFVFCWLGACIGLALRSIEAVNSIGFSFVMPLTMISSAFTRPEVLPSWMRGFAEHQPFSLVVDSIRSYINGFPDAGNKPMYSVIWMVGSLIVLMPLSLWLFERRNRA